MTDPARAVEITFDVAATMRDGVTLAADVYAPASPDRPLPTLLMRTPYGKHNAVENAWTGIDAVSAARAGFLVVIQDTRGRFASEGDWDPLRHDAADGVDSVEWAAALPGSNGQVGLFGGSYSGNTQWQAALGRPSQLRAMSLLMTWADPHDGLYSRGGALELGLDLAWSLVTGIDDVVRRFGTDDSLGARIDALLDEFDALPEVGFRGTRTDLADLLGRHDVRDIGSLAALGVAGTAPSPDPADLSAKQPDAGVPTLQTAGWYDIFLQGTLDNHQAMVRAGHESTLVVGPWSHENFGNVVGEVDFGIRAMRDSPVIVPEGGSWPEAQLAWLRDRLDPEGGPGLAMPAVRIFTMGRNEWRSEPSWPPPGGRDTELFLHPDGRLSEDRPAVDVPPVSYSYDLGDPVPTVGGNTYITPAFPAGPRDQRDVEARPDVLTFTSDVLTADLEVTGRVLAHLHATSSAGSADWVVRLCDVHPNGRSFNICDGVVRAGDDGDVTVRTVDLWSTSMVFRSGHRLRVHVANSSFPRWDRCPPQVGHGHEPQTARLFLDADRPSRLVLPVIDRKHQEPDGPGTAAR